MRIAICTNFYHPSQGGAEIVAKRVAEYYAQSHEVSVFTRGLMSRKDRNVGGVEIREYDPASRDGFLGSLKKWKPEFVLVYSDMFDFLLPLIQNYDGRLSIGLCGANRLHDRPGDMNRFVECSGKISSIFVHSTVDRDYKLCQRLKLMDIVKVIPNGVDFSEFDGNKETRTSLLPKHADSYWILNVSNFFPGKGQSHILDILQQMSPPRPVTYIQVASKSDFSFCKTMEEDWNRRCSQKVANVTVSLQKGIPREKVVGFFKNANAFCFSSEKEVAPLVLLECLAAGLPWVSANVGNASELPGGFCIGSVRDSRGYVVFDDRLRRKFGQRLGEILYDGRTPDCDRTQVEKTYGWPSILPVYGSLLA